MKTVSIHEFGDPAKVLTSASAPDPRPSAGHVRVKMLMSPIHNHDLSIIRGEYGYKPPLPAIPGTEAVGIVDQVGGGVTHVKVGQRVAVAGVSATWAEWFLVPAAKVVPLPDAISDETACQLIAMPLSAVILLNDLNLKPGDWLIQNAANGAVGKIVDTVGRSRGVNVINVVRRDAAVDALKKTGAVHVISSESGRLTEKVAALTGGAPVLKAVDSIGGTAANDLMEVLGFGGQLTVFGGMSGQPLQIGVGHVLFKQATVKGFWGSKRTEELGAAEVGKIVGELIGLAAAGTLKLGVEAKFPLSRASEAAAASAQPGRAGKIVLVP